MERAWGGKILGRFGGAALVLGPGPAGAESSVSGHLAPAFPSAPSYGAEALTIFLYLGGLVVLLILLRLGLRRPWLGRSRQPQGRPIRVVAQQFLEPRKSLMVVEVEGRRLLLAAVADRLDLLLELGEQSSWPRAGGGLDADTSQARHSEGRVAHVDAG